MDYSAIVTYTTGVSTGATVRANSCEETWHKLLAVFNGGANICRVELVQVLTCERVID